MPTELLKPFDEKKGWGGPVAFSPDGKRALVSQYFYGANKEPTSRLVLCKASSGEQIWDSSTSAQAGGFTADGKEVFGWQPDNTLCFWDVTSGKKVKSFLLDPGKPNPKNRFRRQVVRTVSSEGGLALTAIGENEFRYGVDIKIKVWDLHKGKLLHTWADPSRP